MSDIYIGKLVSSNYLEHHGILGMKWGIRRFQREDGSLTSAGKKRKLVNEHKNEAEKKAEKAGADAEERRNSKKLAKDVNKSLDGDGGSNRGLSPATKKRIAVGVAAVAAVAGAYAAYKIYDKRVPKYVDVGKSIINTKKISYSDDLVGKLPNGPSSTHPNKILKQTFTVNDTFNKTEKSNFTKSVPNPDRKFFSARGDNTDEFNSRLNRLASSTSFSDSRKNEAAKRINEKFARDVDDTVKAFRTGKINRKEYAARLKSLQTTVDLSDRDEKKKKR